MISERRTEILQLVAVLSASLCGGLVFHVLNLPVAWLLGPMFAGSLLAFASSEPKQIPHPARAGAQVVIGVAVGLRLSPEAFWGLGSELPFLLLLVAATGALSMLNGYLLGRFAGVDPATGFLGSIPGAASGMIAISGDLGADPRLVALLQYMRVLLVALLVPFFVQHAAPHLMGAESGTQPSALDSTDGLAATLGDIGTHCLLVAYAVAGWAVGRRLRFPSPSLLGPLAVAAAGTLLLGPLPFPEWLFNAALLVLGAWIGVQFDAPFVRRLGRIALVEAILVVLLVAGAALLGFAFSRLTGVHLVTALLASSPGAMEAMVALSIKLDAHTPLVVSIQMVRFLAMLFAGPWIASKLVRLAGGGPPAELQAEFEAELEAVSKAASPSSPKEGRGEVSKPSP